MSHVFARDDRVVSMEGFCGRGPPLPGGRGASLGGILAVFDDDASYGGHQ